jgi:hypothetical protein
MEIKDLAKKYTLSKDDFWQLPQNDKIWIITHDAVEKIASIENIQMVDIETVNSTDDLVRFIITMKMGDKTIIDVGEADRKNCRTNYLFCMAFKRGVDRCVLKLINAYEYGVYSDTEADDFKKPHTSIYHKRDDQIVDFDRLLKHDAFTGKKKEVKDAWRDADTLAKTELVLSRMKQNVAKHENEMNGQLKEVADAS